MENTNKIFQIGFNKCATRAICNFIGNAHNIDDEHIHHHRRGEIASHIFSDIHNGVKPLSRYPRVDEVRMFADMENVSRTNGGIPIMAYEYFKELYDAYPNSKFILNIRNKEDWIESRINHNSNLGHLSYIKRWKKLCKISENEVLELWENHWDEHIQQVENFFKGDKEHQLLTYHINNDHHSKIVSFLDELDFPKSARMRIIK